MKPNRRRRNNSPNSTAATALAKAVNQGRSSVLTITTTEITITTDKAATTVTITVPASITKDPSRAAITVISVPADLINPVLTETKNRASIITDVR